MVTESEAREILAARRGANAPPVEDDTLLEDLGIDLLDLVGFSFAFELDRAFGDEVPTALLASLRTVRDFLDLFAHWQRDTMLDIEPQTMRSA